MYGLLIESIIEIIKTKYGENTWEMVRKKAKLEYSTFNVHQQYSETVIQRIVKQLAEATGQSMDSVMDLMGENFIIFFTKFGYERILRVLGRHMRDFLNGLDNLHEYMRSTYQKSKPPSFFVEQETSTGLVLHYRTKRKGFIHYVKGQIRQVGKSFYGLDVQIDILSEKQEMDIQHVVFQINFENSEFTKISNSNSTSEVYVQHIGSNLPIRSEIFFELFPFHVVFKRDLEILSVGESLKNAIKHVEGEGVRDVFNLVRPLMNFTWENLMAHTNNVFEITTIEPVRRVDSDSDNDSPLKKDRDLLDSNYETPKKDLVNDDGLKLRGQMMYIEEWDSMIFLASPILENLDVMFQTGFYINDLSMHDSSRDLVLVGTQQSAELKLALDQEKQKSKALAENMRKLDVEIKRTDQLLYQMIPKKIADRLRSGEAVMNICEVFNNCTILFSDVVGFTSICSQLSPMEVVSMLNEMYTKFDKCLELHNVYKVETIGDAYMVVSGLPERTDNHATEVIEMAFDMLAAISTLRNPATGETMMIRIGCHSGPTVAGVVGLKMPRYCLFGDAVNTASRMESNSEAMKIHISESTNSFLEKKSYKVVERGKIEIKGKGEMKTYFVLSRFDKRGKEVKCTLMDVFEVMNEKARVHTTDIREDVENNINPKNSLHSESDDAKSICSRGYSPITMEDVRKSMTSLKSKSQLNILSPLPLLHDAIPEKSRTEQSGTFKLNNSEKLASDLKNKTKQKENENTERGDACSSKNIDSQKRIKESANKIISKNNEMHEKERKDKESNSVKSIRSNATGNISLGTNIVKRVENNNDKILKNPPKPNSISSHGSHISLKDKANTATFITPRKPYQQRYGDIEFKADDLQQSNQVPPVEEKQTIVVGNTFKATVDQVNKNIKNTNRVDPNLIINNNDVNNSNATTTTATINVQKKKFSFKSLLCQIL